jgi:hypothetical protein
MPDPRSTAPTLKICRTSLLTSVALLLFLPNVESVAQQEKIRVPNVIGSTLAEAEHTLALSGLRLGTVTERPSHQTGGIVLEQHPRPGKTVLGGTRVDLVVSEMNHPNSRRQPPLQGPPPPSPNFSELDHLLSKLPLGNIIFNVPNKMVLAQSYEINLLLSATKSLEELRKELPGKIEGAEIRIAPKMEARLTGQDFAIIAVKPEVQGVSGQETTEWEWEVKPSSSGSHQLHLTINAILSVNGVETSRSITTFDRKITIEVSFGRVVLNFITNNWQWLWTAILIPVAAWVWKKKRKSQVGAKN